MVTSPAAHGVTQSLSSLPVETAQDNGNQPEVVINKYKEIKQSRSTTLPFCMNVGMKLEGLISLGIPHAHVHSCSSHNSKGMAAASMSTNR